MLVTFKEKLADATQCYCTARLLCFESLEDCHAAIVADRKKIEQIIKGGMRWV